MARSDILTMIPLDRAAKIIGIDPYHFNSITTLRRPETNACDDIWFQTSDQRVGQLSRDDLAIALKQAETIVSNYLGYFLIPQWIQNEEQIVTKPYSPELFNFTGRNSRGQPKSVVTSKGYVIEGGVKAKTLILAGAAVVYSDANSDGFDELATVSVVTSVTEPQEIHVFFPGKSGSDKWEIKPITVSISGGTATITFPKYLSPNPNLWTNEPLEGDILRTINGDSNSNFLSTLDVYRVYNDPSNQAVLYCEGCSCDSCGGSGCVVCGWTTNSGCIRVRDSRRGIITYTAAVWNSGTLSFDSLADCCWSEPDKLYINYRSGIRNYDLDQPDLQMAPAFERMIVYYALTLIDREMNGCENSRNIWKHQNEDLAKSESSSSGSVSYSLTGRMASNPLGTKRAAINLWRALEQNRLPQGR
jgi:hypothetical protein